MLPPHVFDNVRPDASIAKDETFGPLVPVLKTDNEEHVLWLANDTEYGLASAVFSGDIERGVRFALRIEAGMTHVNDISVADQPNAPFGGEKNSGLGRFNANGQLRNSRVTTGSRSSTGRVPIRSDADAVRRTVMRLACAAATSP